MFYLGIVTCCQSAAAPAFIWYTHRPGSFRMPPGTPWNVFFDDTAISLLSMSFVVNNQWLTPLLLLLITRSTFRRGPPRRKTRKNLPTKQQVKHSDVGRLGHWEYLTHLTATNLKRTLKKKSKIPGIRLSRQLKAVGKFRTENWTKMKVNYKDKSEYFGWMNIKPIFSNRGRLGKKEKKLDVITSSNYNVNSKPP